MCGAVVATCSRMGHYIIPLKLLYHCAHLKQFVIEWVPSTVLKLSTVTLNEQF